MYSVRVRSADPVHALPGWSVREVPVEARRQGGAEMTIIRHGMTDATNALPIISRAVVRGDIV